ADARGPSDREGGAGHYWPALSGALHQGGEVPFAPEATGADGGEDEEEAEGDYQRAADLVERFAVVAKELADRARGQAEDDDEDHREGPDEEQSGGEDAAP